MSARTVHPKKPNAADSVFLLEVSIRRNTFRSIRRNTFRPRIAHCHERSLGPGGAIRLEDLAVKEAMIRWTSVTKASAAP